MDVQDFLSLQEAYLEVYQEQGSLASRARNAVADQRLGDAQRSTDASMNRLRHQSNSNRVARADASTAARKVERDVRTSNNTGPQRPQPGTVTGRRIEKPKPTGSKPTGSRIGGSSSLGGVSTSSGSSGYTPGSGRGYGISGIKLADSYEYDIYDIILSHLLDEGYADTEESALVIMANMSEEWREGIVEMMGGAGGMGRMNFSMSRTSGASPRPSGTPTSNRPNTRPSNTNNTSRERIKLSNPLLSRPSSTIR